MFSKISLYGIVMDNMRSLVILITLGSILSVLFIPKEVFLISLGSALGGYYGYKIESEINDFKTMGGRVFRGETMDYLVLSSPE